MVVNPARPYTRFQPYLLLAILALAFFIGMIPKLNYPYPVHVDEWTHWAYSQAVVTNGSISFTDPLVGNKTTGFISNLEIGYHVFNGIFQMISGLPWLIIIRYLPSLIFVFTVLSVYILARRQGFGLEAALCTCLVITTVGILGPAFFVAVALGLLFLPLLFFLLLNYRSWRSLLLVFLVILFLMLAHPPSAVLAVLALVPFYLLNLRYDFRHNLKIALIALVFLACAVPFMIESHVIVSQVKTLATARGPIDYHDLPILVHHYGILPVIVGLVGVGILTLQGGKSNLSLALGLLAVSSMLAVFHNLRYGMAMLYLRGLLFVLLLLGIAAGAGIMGLRRFAAAIAARYFKPAHAAGVGFAVSFTLVLVILGIALPQRLTEPYYLMINSQDYYDYAWCRNFVTVNKSRGIVDPWQGTAFSAVTGFPAYARILVAPGVDARKASSFLSDKARETRFLIANGINIVLLRDTSPNTDLIRVRNGVYLLRTTK